MLGAEVPKDRIGEVLDCVEIEELLNFRRHEGKGTVDVDRGQAVVHPGLGSGQVLRSHRRDPCEAFLRANRAATAGLAGNGRRQRTPGARGAQSPWRRRTCRWR